MDLYAETDEGGSHDECRRHFAHPPSSGQNADVMEERQRTCGGVKAKSEAVKMGTEAGSSTGVSGFISAMIGPVTGHLHAQRGLLGLSVRTLSHMQNPLNNHQKFELPGTHLRRNRTKILRLQVRLFRL